MVKDKEGALIVLSGGQDSCTCLYWAINKWEKENVRAITFDYGQKHVVETKQAKIIAQKAGIQWELLKACKLLSMSPLVNKSQKLGKYKSTNDLPGGVEPTFIPGRNILFLTLAANYATFYGIKHLVTGVCQADFGGYYDCRQIFIDVMAKTLSQGIYGNNTELKIHTPLMYLTKRKTVELMSKLGHIDKLVDTHTCYTGKRPACGHCHACLIRLRGFEEAGIKDPIEYKDGKRKN